MTATDDADRQAMEAAKQTAYFMASEQAREHMFLAGLAHAAHTSEPSDEEVERAASAILFGEREIEWGDADIEGVDRRHYLGLARAALTAAKTPPEEER